MKKIICFCLIMTTCIVGLIAQKKDNDSFIDSIKGNITRFFINERLLDSNIVEDNLNYIFANEIVLNSAVGYQVNGIYRIGVYQSHTPEYLLIKCDKEFTIYNLSDIRTVLLEIINYSKRINISNEMMFIYLNSVMDMSKRNNDLGGFKKIPKTSNKPSAKL